MARYRVRDGLNRPDGKGGERRYEPGDLVDDLSDAEITWLSDGGHIEPAPSKSPPKKEG